MKEFIKENWFKIIMAFTMFLIGFSVLYYFVIFLPQKFKKQRARELTNEILLEKCLHETTEIYKEKWNNYCKIDGKEIREDGTCLLNTERAETLGKQLDKIKNECFKKYPQ